MLRQLKPLQLPEVCKVFAYLQAVGAPTLILIDPVLALRLLTGEQQREYLSTLYKLLKENS